MKGDVNDDYARDTGMLDNDFPPQQLLEGRYVRFKRYLIYGLLVLLFMTLVAIGYLVFNGKLKWGVPWRETVPLLSDFNRVLPAPPLAIKSTLVDCLPEQSNHSRHEATKSVDTPMVANQFEWMQVKEQLVRLSSQLQAQQQVFAHGQSNMDKQFKLITTQLDALKKPHTNGLGVAKSSPIIGPFAVKRGAMPSNRVFKPNKSAGVQLSKPRKLMVVRAITKPKSNAHVHVSRMSVLSPAATAARPPFSLASIDQWGNQTHAVLRYRGKLQPLSLGSSWLNWQLVTVNAAGDGIQVIDPEGHSAVLRLP